MPTNGLVIVAAFLVCFSAFKNGLIASIAFAIVAALMLYPYIYT